MKRITKQIVYAVLSIVILTQCDSVTSPSDKTELKSSEHTTPTNANDETEQSLATELTWEQIRGAKTYRVLLSESDKFETSVMDETITGTSVTTPPLTPETTYHWKVYPIKRNQAGPWSEVWSFTTGSEDSEPETPTSVTLISPVDEADKVSTDLEFTWNPFSETSEYTYQLSDNSTFSSVITEATVSDTSYTPEGLEHQKKYHWRVKVSDDSEGDTWSETWSFTTGTEDSEPETPTSVTLISPVDEADKVSTDLEFTWNELSGTSEYTYQLSDNSTFSSVLTEETVSGTSYKPEGLVHQKKYHWRVKDAGDTEGETWSETWSFTTGMDDTDPGTSITVTLLSPADNAFDISINPEFEWQEVTGVSGYEFQLSGNSSFSSLVEESVESGITYQAGNLDYQRQYYWRVKVSGGSNEWSDARSFTTESETASPPPSSGSFVQVQNSNFVLDGNVKRFAGTNAYYLPNYEKLNPAVVDRAMDLFQDTGITVIRMWGFYDGYDCGYSKNDSNENVIQTAPGVYDESALRDLDNVIAKGKERGIGFIIPFVNYWDELGGICQYNTWAGASNPSTNMEFFLSNNDTQKWFKDYIDMLLNRVNTVTGIAYKDEPAIVAWQVMNEGRNRGASAHVLRDWYQQIAQYIKSIDPNHLVSTGEEGFDDSSLGSWGSDGSFTHPDYSTAEYSNTYVLRANEGTSYVLNTAIPEIDFGTAHWYPNEFGFGTAINEDLLRAQRAWLSDHQKIAASSGKPFVMGEFGFPGWGDERVSDMYNALYDHAESIRLDGNLLWQLVADGTKCWEFGGNICYPGGRADNQLYNEFKQHVTNMQYMK